MLVFLRHLSTEWDEPLHILKAENKDLKSSLDSLQGQMSIMMKMLEMSGE